MIIRVIVALTTYDGDTDIHRALSAGASAYLVKDVLVAELVDAIRNAAAGRRVIPPAVAQRLAEFTPRVELTARSWRCCGSSPRGCATARSRASSAAPTAP
jgi:DNA-binding NarL/FixJ family response regulator